MTIILTTYLDSIKQFSTQCATRGSDIVMIATSRPQGYSEEFSPRAYKHFYLAPLSKKRALHYADRLVTTCHPSDPELRDSITERLERAAKRPTTERLMRSPLQVTILAVLAELRGELPDDRWQLFDEYYQTICHRETQKNEVFSSVIREYALEIGKIHERVGLRLQIANETKGENDAYLSKNEFFAIVHNVLADRFDEHHPQREVVSRQIRDAALGRLVFLVSPKGEEIGFEIRSLQEFMAAKALMSGTDEEIGKRLEAIAPYSFWRNVFLFASGKCARDRPYLTKQIVGICQTLNTDADNQAAVLTLLGSHLCLDLLEDDTFRHHKKTVRALTDIALNLLKLPPGEVHGRLASGCRPMSGLDDQFSAAIVQRLGMEDEGLRMAAWTVLIFIAESGQGWAEGIVKDHWPSDITSQADLLEYSPFLFYGLQSGWIASKVIELIPHIGLTRLPPLREEMAGLPLPKWLTCVMRLHHGPGKYRRAPIRLEGQASEVAGFYLVQLPDDGECEWTDILEMPNPSTIWAPAIAGTRFASCPSKDSLARELSWLDCIGWSYETRSWMSSQLVPWPLAICLESLTWGERLCDLSRRASAGEFGDVGSWRENERRWISDGVSVGEIVDSCSCDLSHEKPWRYLEFDVSRGRRLTASIAPYATAFIEALAQSLEPVPRRVLSRLRA